MSDLRFWLICSSCIALVLSQTINNVRVIDHREYMVNVISETVKKVENREWCNLKLQNFSAYVDTTILNWHMEGTIYYSNGFVVSIQNLDVLQSSLNQIWTNVGDGTVRVEIRGQLRMTNLALGMDVLAELTDGRHHYTGIIVHPLVVFDFSIFRNAHTNEMTVTVVGNHPRILNKMDFLPEDYISDALTTMYDSNSTFDSVTGWAADIFQPIAEEVVRTKVPFPGLCYNCPVT